MSKLQKTISLLCPTRGRSSWAIRLALSALNTAAHPQRVELLFYIDADDPERANYIQEFKVHQPKLNQLMRCLLVIGEPIGVSKAWNELAARCQGDLLVMAADDQIYNDRGWDDRLDTEVAKFPDEIFCIWFNEGHWGENLCTFPIVSRKWCLTLGYFTTGLFECLYDDLWIMDLAKRLNRLHYIPDILTEHFHWSYGKSEIDSTYKHKQVNASGQIKPAVQRDMNLFGRTAPYRETDAKRLASVLAEPVVLQAGLPPIGNTSIFANKFSQNPASKPETEAIAPSIQPDNSNSRSLTSLKLVTLCFPTQPQISFKLLLNEEAAIQKEMLTVFSQNQLYLPEESQFLMQVLQAGDSLIDVGAHIGYFSLLASLLVGEGAIFAIETESQNYATLLKNIQLNQRHNVQPFNIALRATAKTSTQLTHHSNFETLDRLLGQRQIQSLKVIKLAIEGAEHEVLKGGFHLLQTHQVPYVLCRINRSSLHSMGTTEKALRDWMSALSYDTYFLSPSSPNPVRLAPEQYHEPQAMFSLLFSRV